MLRKIVCVLTLGATTLFTSCSSSTSSKTQPCPDEKNKIMNELRSLGYVQDDAGEKEQIKKELDSLGYLQ